MPLYADRLSFPKSVLASACLSVLAITMTTGAGNAADMPFHNMPTARTPNMGTANAMTPNTGAPYTGLCSSQHVLSRVSYYFSHQVRHVPYLPQVQIRSFSDITATRYEPAATPYNITRHYCTAMAMMNDGTMYPVSYVVAENQGFAGLGGFNVDFCVDGFDRWRVHDSACRTLR